MFFTKLTSAVLGLAALVSAGLDCSKPVAGLTQADCQHMSNIGMHSQGKNPTGNAPIWVGNGGANRFNFKNSAGVPVTLVFWQFPPGDYRASFMNAVTPAVTYSIADKASMTVSVNNGVSGAWAGLYNHATTLSPNGQIFNTWGEFTTGPWGTVDVSREVNMKGNGMSINLPGGCVSDMNTCSYHCNDPKAVTCGAAGSYTNVKCSGPNANPSPTDGGCQGLAKGGDIAVTFHKE